MVSGPEVYDPLRVCLFPPRLNEQHQASGPSLFCDVSLVNTSNARFAISGQYFRQLLLSKSSLPPTAGVSYNRLPPLVPSSGLSQGVVLVLEPPSSKPFGSPARALGTLPEPPETAQILFNLSTVAYQGQGGRGTERKDKTVKHGGRAGSPQLGPNLHPPTLHLPPPLPHPSESFIPLPPHSASNHPDGPKPELICGVCHRLFSSASSLTAHMRLHRGGRALSCQHCGKAFIHNKRLQSHEASCRRALTTALPPRKKGLGLLVRHEGDVSELVGDEDHFVKVVDGHVIYFCSVCERSYMTLSSLKRHSNVHSWRRKYPCHFCDKVFALAEYRTKHEVWHTGERRYQCIFCWEAFATYYNLKTHQKAFHGINPGLISSEKTANGGYKQKVNALKLYRLLPMRSQKRPYKTYSDSLANGLLLPSSDPSAAPLPLDSRPGRIPELGLSSVITYGHPKPSVIVHGTAVSSVIVHSNQVTSGSGKSPLSSPSPEASNSQTLPKASVKPIKKHRESTEGHRKRAKLVDSSDTTEESERRSETGRFHHKSRKGQSKGDSSSASQSSVGPESKGSGPLCQITVRIGEEAMVKRSISETDLKRDRSPPPSKAKRTDSSPPDAKEPQYYFRQEVRKQGESEDDEDNLWRPYYSYKPKRKAPHHPKAPDAPSLPPQLGSQPRDQGLRTEPTETDRARERVIPGKGSPSRLSRRSLARHTCPQCHKVCKTSSALNRHVRRHELKHVPVVQSVPVISYPEPRNSTEGVDPQPCQPSDLNAEPHALLLPRGPPPPELERRDDSLAPSGEPRRGEVTGGYPVQDYPLPLIVQGGYRSGKKQDDNVLVSYPTGPLAFGPLGKMVPTGDLAKLPFYPDPYHLLYGPQLLAYPYNLAALPMALNMMAPGSDKVEPLPFLPALFNYAAAAGPYAGMAPHHLVANPSLYNSGGGGKKQRDSNNGKP
uniref:C2H2-type domain-containing protein n=1 Tax=Esox lucius TaxID=8010 RepID=A0A3P8YDG5_ESOLU